MVNVHDYPQFVEQAGGIVEKKTGRFYPWKIKQLNQASTGANPSTGAVRFFIKSVIVTIRLIAADTTTQMMLDVMRNQATYRLVHTLCVPSTAGVVNMQYLNLDCLCDRGSDITVTFAPDAPSACTILIQMAEVDNDG